MNMAVRIPVGDPSLPSELKEKLAEFDTSLTELESSIQPLLDVPHNELMDKLSPLDRAKVDLLTAYTINSLFWMYLNSCGINPKEHAVKGELDRIRSYMKRVKDIQDKAKAPTLNVGAAKRFMKNALWSAAHAQSKQSDATASNESVGETSSSKSTGFSEQASSNLNETPEFSGNKRKSLETDTPKRKHKKFS